MKNNRTEVVGFRVTKEELEAIKEISNLQGKTVSQWCKDVVINVVNKNKTETHLLSVGEKILLEQLVLLRIVLSTSLTDRELSDDKLKRVIKKANEIKQEKASQLIKEFLVNL